MFNQSRVIIIVESIIQITFRTIPHRVCKVFTHPLTHFLLISKRISNKMQTRIFYEKKKKVADDAQI